MRNRELEEVCHKLVCFDIVTAHSRLQVPGFVSSSDQPMAINDVNSPLTPHGSLRSDQKHDGLVIGTHDHPVQGLDDEQKNAEARHESNWTSDVIRPEGKPGEVRRVHPPSEFSSLRKVQKRSFEMPAIGVGGGGEREKSQESEFSPQAFTLER
ncbi:unnamed protein product [Spirodela intermedia]|uniref:Uncharacterized protein n=1 Tax=Spirodela intermedia TaxID=51605 RepID=A0A7I8JLJ4_SPIIN|nr:unnamed protein product [Spirodela intermedia]CAA6671046.1 unnamed protein product [Spirodela intermedia]